MLRGDYKFLCNHRTHTCSSVMQSTDFGVISFIYVLKDSVRGLFIRNLLFLCVTFLVLSLQVLECYSRCSALYY